MLILPNNDLRFWSTPDIKPLTGKLLVLVLSAIEHLAEPVNFHSFIEFNFSMHADKLYESHDRSLPVGMLQIEVLYLSDNIHPINVDIVLFFKILGHVLWVDRHLMLESLFLLV